MSRYPLHPRLSRLVLERLAGVWAPSPAPLRRKCSGLSASGPLFHERHPDADLVVLREKNAPPMNADKRRSKIGRCRVWI